MGDLSRDFALTLSARMLWTAVYVCAPVLGLSMLVGLAVSVLQAVTQVQEASIAFVLKIMDATEVHVRPCEDRGIGGSAEICRARCRRSRSSDELLE